MELEAPSTFYAASSGVLDPRFAIKYSGFDYARSFNLSYILGGLLQPDPENDMENILSRCFYSAMIR
jgi:hypothetical protein